MSGAEKLKEKIVSEASKLAEQVVAEAKLRAEEIVAGARMQAEEKHQRILRQAHLQAEENRRRIRTIAELDARKEVLAAKVRTIENVFQQALTRLQALETAEFRAFILMMLVAAAEKGNEEIIVSARDRVRFTADLLADVNEALEKQGKQGKLVLSAQVREIQGGVILRSGEVEIDCSFDSILRMQRDQLEPEVAAVLFG
ncbi:MAG: V-type ATP synthase subunit E family protein [Firmicutes bacterium]|nr:V-type ATP synthase subunit E family protein [Bacillota bacterium]